MPLADLVINSFHVGLADGPTEVHEMVVARQVLRDYTPADGDIRSCTRPEQERRARALYPDEV